MDKNKKNINGFTILEVIIAIFILSMVVFGSYVLAQQTMAAAALSRSRLVAYYLAQEKIEEIKNTRDNNWLNGNQWNAGILDSDENFSGEEGFERFTRSTNIQNFSEIINGNTIHYADVAVVVEWTERRNDYSVEVVNRIYNWYELY